MKKLSWNNLYKTIGLILILFWSIVPLIWVVINSLRTDEALWDIAIFPTLDEVTISNYVSAFTQYDFPRYFMNSIIISLGAVVLTLVIAIPAAYAFTRLDFPGKKQLFWFVIIALFFPWIVLIIPVFSIYRHTGLYDTYIGIMVIYVVLLLPITIWLLRGFFISSIDEDLEDAAMIDGCTPLSAFFRVILPLSMPALIATAVFSFVIAWNEFIWVFLLTSGPEKRTAVVGLHYLMGMDVARDWNLLLAAMVTVIAPPVIFYSFLQNFLAEAFTTVGGKKG